MRGGFDRPAAKPWNWSLATQPCKPPTSRSAADASSAPRAASPRFSCEISTCRRVRIKTTWCGKSPLCARSQSRPFCSYSASGCSDQESSAENAVRHLAEPADERSGKPSFSTSVGSALERDDKARECCDAPSPRAREPRTRPDRMCSPRWAGRQCLIATRQRRGVDLARALHHSRAGDV